MNDNAEGFNVVLLIHLISFYVLLWRVTLKCLLLPVAGQFALYGKNSFFEP